MSKSQPPDPARQITLLDGDSAEQPDTHRASASSFREHLEYYQNATIRDGSNDREDTVKRPTDEDGQPATFTVKRELGNGFRVTLVECPICFAPLRPQEKPGDHFARHHSPADFGLTPLNDDSTASGARATKAQQTSAGDDQRTFDDY